MQIGSLFVSIQLVKGERCKAQETTDEYNHWKAIATT